MNNIAILRHIIFYCLLILIGACRSMEITHPARGGVDQTEAPFSMQEPNRSQVTEYPKQIALLLPLTGQHAESAKAIQDGFFASFYDSTEKPIVRVYDTSREKDVQRIYEQAVQEGADFVVGPLAKEDVHRLSTMPHRYFKTPVLALNYQPGITPPSQFLQYALAPETEAVQIANKAFEQGYRSAGVIVPDNAWGKRTAAAFTARWEMLGAKVARTVYIHTGLDQSAQVRQLLGIDQSQKRANELKNLLKEKVDFQPKRRQDMDVIVMAAPPEQARLLKPLFDFYYAEDLPVFATSSIYSGTPNPKRDRDINGIVFCDMPWLIDNQQGQKLKQMLARQGEHSDQYNRLFAMGVDAYLLTGQVQQLSRGAMLMGATGQLSLGENNQIERKLSFAKMVNGAPHQMN